MEITILNNLDLKYKDKWKKQFVAPNRTCAEGLWRRTQEYKTKEASGWSSPLDSRRRIIHFYDEYDVVEENDRCRFVVTNIYLWICTTLPEQEMVEYVSTFLKTAEENDWKHSDNKLVKEEVFINFDLVDHHPEDDKEGREFPDGYQTLEITVFNNANFKPNQYSPWGVLKSGIRTKGKRVASPNMISDLRKLSEFAPHQLELGGGASMELGIPPLNHLHEVYRVIDIKTKQFAFGKEDTLILDLLKDYRSFYREKASIVYRKSLLAEPNNFYQLIPSLYQQGIFVGDVITNNFDGLVSLVGLKERYVRKYEDSDIIPKISFHEDAKSLIVIGSHADRRLTQEAARKHGLKVIYVDPESYVDYDGNEVDYPLETVKEEDLLVKMVASEFANNFKKVI